MTTITDKGGCQPIYVDESRQLIRKIRKPDRLHDFPDKEGVRGELDVGVMHLQLDSAATYSTYACRRWTARGAEFLTEPKDHGREIRAYIRDPDGHLIEVGQTTARPSPA